MDSVTPPPPFELLDELGRGAQAIVYRARQTSLNRLVALKVIQSSGTEGADMDLRLRRESKMLGRAAHPNLVGMYEAGELDGRQYLAMELVDGDTLRALMESNPVAVRLRADALFGAILGAVEALHLLDLVHRDLKPANIMVTPAWRPVVMDLGLGKDLGGGTLATQTGMMVGTPSFMAPEVIFGEPATKAADVWALGCLYFCMHAGHSPFSAPSLGELIEFIIHRPLPDLDLTCPHLDSGRREFLRRLLDRDRSRRPVDSARVRQLWMELPEVSIPGPRRRPTSTLSLRAATTPPSTRRPAQFSRTAATSVVALAVALLLGLNQMPASRPSSSPSSGPAGTPSVEARAPVRPLMKSSPEDRTFWGLVAPPSPLPLSWRWRLVEPHRRVLAGGGEAARTLARKLFLAEGRMLGREPLPWLRWLTLNRWLESKVFGPWELDAFSRGIRPIAEDFLVFEATNGVLGKDPRHQFELGLGWVYQYPHAAFGWLLLGFALESEHPTTRPKAIRAYREGLAQPWPPEGGASREEIWCLLARALLLVPGHDIVKEWWPLVPVRGLGGAPILGLSRALSSRPDLFLRLIESMPAQVPDSVEPLLKIYGEIRRKLCDPSTARALLQVLQRRKPDDKRVQTALFLDYIEAGDTAGASALPFPALIHQGAPVMAYYNLGAKAPDILAARDVATSLPQIVLHQVDLLVTRGDVTAALELLQHGGFEHRNGPPLEVAMGLASALGAKASSAQVESALATALDGVTDPISRLRLWTHLAGALSVTPAHGCMERLLGRDKGDGTLVRALWNSRRGQYHTSLSVPPPPDPAVKNDYGYRTALFELYSRPLIEAARGHPVRVDVQAACAAWQPVDTATPLTRYWNAVRARDWAQAARLAEAMMRVDGHEPFWPLALSWLKHLAAPRGNHEELDSTVRAALRHRHAVWALAEVP